MGGGARINQAPGSLIGRNDDLDYITAFVDQAAVSGGALLLSGEGGLGKSVLLDAAAAHAETRSTSFDRSDPLPPAPNVIGMPRLWRKRITEAGLHEKVAALVYIAAFAPDKGESVNTLLAGFPADAPQPPILPPKDGFLFLDREKFPASFAGDLPAGQAAFMADSQVPWGVNALGGTISEASWRIKPSWYLVAGDDRMIPPPAQRAMSERAGSTVTEAPGSHSIYLSQPAAVAALITQAAAATRE